jgi:hypothetical protein
MWGTRFGEKLQIQQQATPAFNPVILHADGSAGCRAHAVSLSEHDALCLNSAICLRQRLVGVLVSVLSCKPTELPLTLQSLDLSCMVPQGETRSDDAQHGGQLCQPPQLSLSWPQENNISCVWTLWSSRCTRSSEGER